MDRCSGLSLRICLVSPVPPPRGGIGHWTTHVHRWAAGKPNVSISQVDISPRWRAIDDLAVWKRVLGGGMQLLRDYNKFLKAVRLADVIHLTTSGQLATMRDLVICATARLLHVPVVYHLHFGRINEIARSNTIEWRMIMRVMRLATVVLVLDSATAATVKKYLPLLRVELTPNPIDVDALPTPEPSQSPKKTAFFLGWILPAKGVEELLQAWSACADKNWELVLAGPVNPEYRDMLLDRYQPRAARFTGDISHEEAMRLMARCDLFILPSHTEAFPYVVLEAMALSKAIVATDVGAIPEMLAKECGILVRPKDVQGLVHVLKKLIDNDALRVDMGRRAYEQAIANYTVEAVFNRLLSLWHGIARHLN